LAEIKKGFEAQIIEAIKGITDRKFDLFEPESPPIFVKFKKTEDEADNKLRAELEKEFAKFSPFRSSIFFVETL